jgi:hypothetical protein
MFDNFINGIKNGLNVANATRKLIMHDKELFMYPVLAALFSLVAAVLILGAGFGLYLVAHFAVMSHAASIALLIITIIVLYFVVFFISTYFTMAMLIAFRSFAKGKRIGMGASLDATAPYTKLILEWSVFYTIIATIIHIIEGAIRALFARFGFIGNIISGLITGGANLALAAAVAFALPVILDEKEGPVDTIKASTTFIMKNFGDTFGGLVFAEIFQIVLTLIGIGVIALGVLVILGSPALLLLSIILFVVGILLIIVGVLFRYVLFNCFKLIVYDYKTRKTLPKGFDAKLIDSSIKRKKQQGKGSGVSPVGFFGQQQGNI